MNLNRALSAWLGERDAVGGAAALRVGALVVKKVAGTDPGVDVALARPDADVLPAGHPGDVIPQVQIREEEDFAIRGDGLDDLRGVRRGAAVVTFRLDL